MGLSQPTVSHHLKLLVEGTREQRGKWAYYRAVPEVLASLGRRDQARQHGPLLMKVEERRDTADQIYDI